MGSFKLAKVLFGVSILSLSLAGCSLLPRTNRLSKSDQSNEDSLSSESQKQYDNDTILANPDDQISYHAVGGYEGTWSANKNNIMTPCSINHIRGYDADLANTLTNKSLQCLYFSKIYIDDIADWENYAVVNGKRISFNGGHTFKCIECLYSVEEMNYLNNRWIPSPEAYTESLTDNIYVPPYQEEHDKYGMDWNSNPIVITENGDYLFVMAKYSDDFTTTKPGWGLGMVKI